jgi:hypothetical protein
MRLDVLNSCTLQRTEKPVSILKANLHRWADLPEASNKPLGDFDGGFEQDPGP